MLEKKFLIVLASQLCSFVRGALVFGRLHMARKLTVVCRLHLVVQGNENGALLPRCSCNGNKCDGKNHPNILFLNIRNLHSINN